MSDNISSTEFTITLNGQSFCLNAPITLDNFLELKQLTTKQGLAIALNERVIPRSKWKEITLKKNDQLLAIIPTQGG